MAKSTADPKQTKLKQKVWKPLTPQAVRMRLSTAVHFSSKPVNTNARASGVRIAGDAQLNVPLVSFITTALNRRTVDYQDGAVAGSMLSQCAAVVEGTVEADYKDTPAEQIALIQGLATTLDEKAEVGTGTIDARLRQVLFPDASSPTGYVALTPLHSSVFSAHLRKTLQAETDRRAAQGDRARRSQTLIMVGGSKAQNVGRIGLVGAMQRALVFDAPRENPQLRAAYALFHKGVPVRSLVHRKTLTELATWREQQRNQQGRIVSSTSVRADERELLARLARDAMVALEAKRAVLAPFVQDLGGWASQDLDDFDRALLDKAARSRDWPREMAARLLRIVESHQTTHDARPIAGFGDIDDYLNMMAEHLQ